MEKHEILCDALCKLNLDDIEKVVKEAYHKEDGPGRPPRKPMGSSGHCLLRGFCRFPAKENYANAMFQA